MGILQAGILEWVAMPFSRGSSQPGDRFPAFQAGSLPSEPPGKPKNTGVVSPSLLQGIFPTQKSNQGFLYCRQILYHLSYQGRPIFINQFRLVTQSCLTLCNPMDCSMPGFPVHHQFPELAQTHVHWVSDGIQPSHPLSSPSAFNLSQHQGLFPWVTSLHWGPKYCSFSINPSNEYSGLISFRIDWLDLLAVQGTLKSLCQHHSSKTSILQPSALWSNSHIHLWLLGKPYLWLYLPLSLLSLLFIFIFCVCFLICCLGSSELVFQGASIF